MKKRLKFQIHFFFILISLLMICERTYSQNITGVVLDKLSKEPITGALVYNKKNATVSDLKGNYNLQVNLGDWVYCQFLGYSLDSIKIDNLEKGRIFALSQESVSLNTIEIIANNDNYFKRQAQTGFIQLSRDDILKMPSLLGESDVIKTIQTVPGVKFGVEGSSGIYVRGGNSGQNLFLIDEIPVFNTDHAFGFFSIIPARTTKNINIYKSGFPAEYGNRTSSVIDVKTLDGNKNKRVSNLSVSNIAASAYLEGPLLKDKISYVVTGRYSFLKFFTDFGFYDASIKLDYRINDLSRISYFGLYTDDDYDDFFKDSFGRYNQRDKVKWNNFLNGINYSTILGNNLSLNASIHNSSYDLDATSERMALRKNISSYDSKFNSAISDLGGKVFLSRAIKKSHFKIGGGFSRFKASPEQSSFVEFRTDTLSSFSVNLPEQGFNMYYAFMQGESEVTKALSLNYGMRYNFVSNNQKNVQAEPRINLRWLINNNHIAKLSYTVMHQNNHYLSGASISLPTDTWINADQNIKPSKSWQVSMAYNILNVYKNLSFESEIYYKNTENEYFRVPGFLPHSQSYLDKISPARGISYGLENQLTYNLEKLSLKVGYTLARSSRKFYDININNNLSFPFRFDKRHDINFTAFYNYSVKQKANKSTSQSISFEWTYNSGAHFTIDKILVYNPTLYRNLNNLSKGPISAFPESINNYNAPDFHRLNLSWTHQVVKGKIKRKLVAGLYNAYNRRNVFILQSEIFSIFPRKNNAIDYRLSLKSNSLFPILPFVAYEIEF